MMGHFRQATTQIRLGIVAIAGMLLFNCIYEIHRQEPQKLLQPIYRSEENPLFDKLRTIGTVELTVRLSTNPNILKFFFCDFLRSSAFFWYPGYGPITLILDETNKKDAITEIHRENLPFKFRFVYESYPKDLSRFQLAHKHMKSRAFGYSIQLYSSFLMDLYTNASVIAWTDTDTIFTTLVTPNRIHRNGKLQVLGINTYRIPHVPGWAGMTKSFLGLPFVADFMTYFPVYLYPSTIKNCREFIMKRFNRATFLDAFVDGVKAGPKGSIVSSVNVILSYAFHYEKHLYEFHIDLWQTPLKVYNEKYLNPANFLQPSDLQPDLHVTIHSKYFNAQYETLSNAVCYVRRLQPNQISPMCTATRKSIFNTLYSFDTSNGVNHLQTWCGGMQNKTCTDLILQHDSDVARFMGVFPIRWKVFEDVERVAHSKHNIMCPSVHLG